jgi:hypothetical protein
MIGELEGIERSGRGLNDILSGHLPGDCGKPRKTSGRVSSNPSEIRTEHIPNISYLYTKLFGEIDVSVCKYLKKMEPVFLTQSVQINCMKYAFICETLYYMQLH